MSKVVQAINAMIANPEKIESVVASGSEYYFTYKNKYKWSIKKDNDEIIIYYYPDNKPLEQIIADSNSNWSNVTYINYNLSDIRSREADASFAELYTLVSEKAYGIDEVFKDIISDLDEDLPF